MNKLDRLGKRHSDSVLTALEIIEKAIRLEEDKPITNFDYEVWNVRIKYFG